jgi:hypothetical protein
MEVSPSGVLWRPYITIIIGRIGGLYIAIRKGKFGGLLVAIIIGKLESSIKPL